MESFSQPDFRKMATEALFFKALKQYISATMPIRVIKLPQEEFMERDKVFSYLKGKLMASKDYQDLLGNIASSMDATEVMQMPDHTYTNAKAEKRIEDSALIQRLFKNHTSFAVLSHTWIVKPSPEEEVSKPDKREIKFQDTKTIVKENSKIRILSPEVKGPGFDKFKKFCRVVSEIYGIEFAWMDTICIDKPAEIDVSIGSMFKWYSKSSMCIVYLASTSDYNDVASDPWFTRGWTLQELMVSNRVAFLSREWKPMASYDRNDNIRRLKEQQMTKVIHQVTSITTDELYGFEPGLMHGIPLRMIWIAKRATSEAEDIAYSVMGIFGVVFLVNYGEGKERAFFRLLAAIIQQSVALNTLSIFNYAGRSVSNDIHRTNILPSDPQCYVHNHVPLNAFVHYAPLKPLRLGSDGLKVSLILIFAVLDKSFSENIASGLDTHPTFTCLQNSHAKIWTDERIVVHLFHNTAEDRAKLASHNCFVFGIWNFQEKEIESEIILPNICPAFLLQLNVPDKVSIDMIERIGNVSPASKVDTKEVIVLNKRKDRPEPLVLGKEDLDYFNMSYAVCCL